jgi:hypothetical protein
MMVGDFLNLLQAVRQTSRGWVGRCPAHEDKSPSLSIREGEEHRILLHCFGGCTTAEICTALHLKLRDLFSDSDRQWPLLQNERRRQYTLRAIEERKRHARGAEIDVLREADQLIRDARKIDISAWSHAKLDEELNRLADAHEVLRHEGVLYEPR